MKYSIIRFEYNSEGETLEMVTIVTNLPNTAFKDTSAKPGKTYEYVIEAYNDDGSYQDRNVVFVKGEPEPEPEPEPSNVQRFVSNRALLWGDLPTVAPDNHSLKRISIEQRDNVPVAVETGKTNKILSLKTLKFVEKKETVIEYQTRAVYTYEADFEWNNGQYVGTPPTDEEIEDWLEEQKNAIIEAWESLSPEEQQQVIDWLEENFPDWEGGSFDLDALGSSMWDYDDIKKLDWLMDVLAFKDNRLYDSTYAFAHASLQNLTALPSLKNDKHLTRDGMFFGTLIPDDFDFSPINMEHTKSTRRMFGETKFPNTLTEVNLDVSNVENVFAMFMYSTGKPDIRSFDTSNWGITFYGNPYWCIPVENCTNDSNPTLCTIADIFSWLAVEAFLGMYSVFTYTEMDQDLSGLCFEHVVDNGCESPGNWAPFIPPTLDADAESLPDEYRPQWGAPC